MKIGCQPWLLENFTHELVQWVITRWHLGHGVALSKKSTLQPAPTTLRRRPRLEPCSPVWLAMMQMMVAVIFKSQQSVIETTNMCKKHDVFVPPFEFTEFHPLFLRIDWHFEGKVWGSQSPVPNCFDSRRVLRQLDSGFFHAGHLASQNNVRCEPHADGNQRHGESNETNVFFDQLMYC